MFRLAATRVKKQLSRKEINSVNLVSAWYLHYTSYFLVMKLNHIYLVKQNYIYHYIYLHN